MVRDSGTYVHVRQLLGPLGALPAVLLAAACTRGRTGSPAARPTDVPEAAGPSVAARVAAPAMREPASPARLRLLFTGEAEGYLSPCGCAEGMLGGLARRRTFVEGERASSGRAVVLLDSGGLVKDNGRQSGIKIDTLLAAYALMGYGAVVPGGADLSLGRVLQASLENHPDFPLVAANLQAEDLARSIAPYRILRAVDPGGAVVRIGVAGVLDPALGAAYALGDGVRIGDPVEALRGLLPALKEESDVRILLAHAPRERARAWAEAVPGFACVAAGLGQESPPEEPERVGDAILFHTGTWGKYVVRIDVDLGPPGPVWRYGRVAIDRRFPSDPETNALLLAYQRIIQELGSKGAFLGPRKPHPRDRFAGSRACKPCHGTSWDVYEASKHAHAMKTLVDLGVDKDPECIPCHAVGWEYETGFRSLEETPELAGVGCEECHGPGAKHAEEGGEGRLDPVDESTCRRCHTDLRSPEFSFEEYSRKIEHKE